VPESSAPAQTPTPTPASEAPGGRVARRFRPYHWLAVVPMLGLLGGLPFVNRVEPFVLGLPLLMAWIVAWVVATSVVMGVIYWLDRARERAEG
jgi:Protein of unknown function (DUF3311)